MVKLPQRSPLIPSSSLLRHRYQTLEFGNTDIHVCTLRDVQQFSDPDGAAESMGVSPATWGLFGVIWESSEILAKVMLEFDIRNKRILEVGCGIALSSLVLNSRDADITATDQHPQARRYLQRNVRLNGGRPIPFVRTGWEDPESTLGLFDLIIGSDLLYQPDHPSQLSAFICQHAKPGCQVIIIDPSRGNAGKFSHSMTESGFVQCDLSVSQHLADGQQYRGQLRNYVRVPG